MELNQTSSGAVEMDTVMSSALSGQFIAPASLHAAVHTHQHETTSLTKESRLNTTQNAPAQSATASRHHKNSKLRKQIQSEAFTHLCRSQACTRLVLTTFPECIRLRVWLQVGRAYSTTSVKRGAQRGRGRGGG